MAPSRGQTRKLQFSVQTGSFINDNMKCLLLMKIKKYNVCGSKGFYFSSYN